MKTDSHETWKCADPMAGKANSMVSVYSTLCRCTATSNFINAVKRQRNLGLGSDMLSLCNDHITNAVSCEPLLLTTYKLYCPNLFIDVCYLK